MIRSDAHQAQEITESGKPWLLYVDDDSSNLTVMQMRLEERYEVLTASTDREACKILRSNGTRLSLVLMDIQLMGSQLDGVGLTRLIRGTLDEARKPAIARGVPAFKSLPIIFVTAFGEQYDIEALKRAGGNAVIAKPIDFVKLSCAMTRYHLSKVLT